MNKLGAKYKAIKNVDERRKTFLIDMAEFYNSGNRSVDEDSFCVYSGGSFSPGCAIGRCLGPSLRKRLDQCEDKDIYNIYDKLYLLNRLPKWMTEMGLEFLGDAQSFHDDYTNWNKTGLSERGKRIFQSLKEKYFIQN